MWYSALAKSYNELYKEEQLKKIKLILNNIEIPKTSLLLDVGCGTGISFQEFKCNKVGIDPEIDLLKQAQKPVICGMSETLPFKDQKFDVVISLTAIHNFNDFKKGLREIKRVGKGIFVLSILRKANKKYDIVKEIKRLFNIKRKLDEEKDIIFMS